MVVLVIGVVVSRPLLGCDRPARQFVADLITSPLPSSYIKAVPDAFDWRNVNGIGMLTPVGNQFMPKYCG
jgi:hypothetical protein